MNALYSEFAVVSSFEGIFLIRSRSKAELSFPSTSTNSI